ncbi:hypothetical protein [Mesorhizobium sp. M0633]|uniref:hypothetical protein n=1 Tax=Mesorhizobium sp. M0633 TaxID=2956977 RepID=UPI00333ACACC
MADNEGLEQFTLTLKGNGVEIKREISPDQFAAIMSVVIGRDMSASNTSTASTGAPVELPVKISLREFLDEVKAVRKPDQIVAIGHYIGLHEGQPTFSREDIKDRFAAAREPMPSNFPRDFGVAIKAGAIAGAHQKAGHYYVTKTGIQAVDRHFGADAKK